MTMNGTSWLLGGGYPWYSGDPAADRPGSGRSSVVANENNGLSLATLRDAPLGLMSEDGSLGRLTLPLGVAVDGETVLILSADGTLVYRYDATGATLVPLPQVGTDGLGTEAADTVFAEPRRFRSATNIAASGGALYVTDPAERRVQVFDLTSLALLRIHGDLGDPIDVTAGPHGIYILDRAAGRVYRALPWSDSLALLADVPTMRGRWSRISVDRDERVYVLDRTAAEPALDVIVPSALGSVTTISERFVDSAQVRDRFAMPEIQVDGHGGFVLPIRLADPCGLRRRLDAQLKRWSFGDRAYIVDTRTRKLRVHLADGRLRHRFGPYDANGTAVPIDSSDAWSPVDILAVNECVLILDERHQTVYGHAPGTEVLRKWLVAPAGHEMRWCRIAHDELGCLLLWDGVGNRVDRFDQRGRSLGQVSAREVQHYFNLSASKPKDADVQPLPRLTRNGAVSRIPKEPPQWPKPPHVKYGVWISRWLDSEIYNCQWRLIELSIQALPPGSRIVVKTRTSNDAQSDAEVLANFSGIASIGSWRETAPIVGPAQLREEEPLDRHIDLLVPSGPGRFIELLIELTGNGLSTPVIGSLRLRFPRESLLQYLPAIYSSPEEQRHFLDCLLEIMQTTWSDIERQLETFQRFLDPDSVRPEAMAYVASWLDLRLEGTWTAEENRRLLQATPGLRARWGTAEGMRRWLQVYLAKLGGIDKDTLEMAGIPALVESFVERRRLMLGREDLADLSAAEGLWSPSVERRFQVGVFDREGEVELVSTGDPQLDVFRRYAHSFRVYVPAAWVRTPDDEALIRRAIEMQKPAHTIYELVLVEPRFLIGEQSTIDLDTVIGAPLGGPLVCPDVEDAPSRAPYQRLGFDTVLGCGDEHHGLCGLERSLV